MLANGRTILSTCAIRSATRGGSCTPSALRKELKKLTITMAAVALAAALDAGRGRGGGSGGVAVVDEDGSRSGGGKRFPLTTAVFCCTLKIDVDIVRGTIHGKYGRYYIPITFLSRE